jgi:hypothetical protein
VTRHAAHAFAQEPEDGEEDDALEAPVKLRRWRGGRVLRRV